MAATPEHCASGYKPQQVQLLVGISKQTLQYWRKTLDPQVRRSLYPASAVLVYRVVWSLTQEGGLRVSDIKKCNFSDLFGYIQRFSPDQLLNKTFLVDLRRRSWAIVGRLSTLQQNDIEVFPLALGPVISAHRRAFESLGDPPPDPDSSFRRWSTRRGCIHPNVQVEKRAALMRPSSD